MDDLIQDISKLSVSLGDLLSYFYRMNTKTKAEDRKKRPREPLSLVENPAGFLPSDDAPVGTNIKVAIYHRRFYAVIEQGLVKEGPHKVFLMRQQFLCTEDRQGYHVLVAIKRGKFNFYKDIEILDALDSYIADQSYAQSERKARVMVDIDVNLDKKDQIW